MTGVTNVGGINLTAGNIPPGGDLETLLMAITTDRSNALNAVAQGQAASMQQSNGKIAELNQALNDLRAHAPSKDEKDQSVTGVSQQTKDTLAKYGITYSDYIGSDNKTKANSGFGNLMEAVKTSIDTISSTSQLDMIKLQGLINKSNQAVEMLTNLVQKFSDTKSKIIGNIR